jgi:glycyl-tRNA synthetase
MSQTQTAVPTIDNADKSMDDIMALCKRRGFIYQASEIYGGINGFWDYGPLGTHLKKNLRDAWWQDMVLNPPMGPDDKPVSIVPIDSCIIQNPKVWEASGHVGGFNDFMVDDKEIKQRFRADHLFGIHIQNILQPMKEMIEEPVKDVIFTGNSVVYIPVKTLVASGLGEATTLLIEDKKIRKKVGIKSITVLSEQPEDDTIALRVDFGSGEVNAYLTSAFMALLQASKSVPSPFTGNKGLLSEPRAFNLMFKTYVGATASDDDTAYLRPETAQGIFINFKNVMDSTRVDVPFGIAQVGKAFRNEVTPRNFTFRSREFEQMEIEFFCPPEKAKEWYEFWQEVRFKWWQDIGLSNANLNLRRHNQDELAHYAKEGAGTSDIEYRFPFTAPGFGELEGVADRSTFDLKAHEEASRAKMQYLDRTKGEIAKNGQPKGQWVTPNVIEPSAGLDRGVLALLCEAYTPDETRPSKMFMRFHPRVSPIKAAVFPLVNKDGMPEVAAKLAGELKKRFGVVEHDAKQNIGKRYARMDEAGCPFCFTIDSDTLGDQTVTVRDRDTAGQQRINIEKVASFLGDQLAAE